MSDKPPAGLRPRWLALEERELEIRFAMKRYDERALLVPDEWLLELTEIQRQLAELRQPTNELPPQQPVPEPAPPATVAIPLNRFVSISRTIQANGSHTLDAIDDDGVAWWMVLADVPGADVWRRLAPLPVREVPAQ